MMSEKVLRDAMLLASKVEEGASSKGMQVALEEEERVLYLPERNTATPAP